MKSWIDGNAWRKSRIFPFLKIGEYVFMRLDYIEAGEIVTTHGVRGEVKVLPWLDSPEDLCDFDRVRIDGKEYEMESCRVQKTCNLVKLRGVDTMEAAQLLRGKTVQLYREDIDPDVSFANVENRLQMLIMNVKSNLAETV